MQHDIQGMNRHHLPNSIDGKRVKDCSTTYRNLPVKLVSTQLSVDMEELLHEQRVYVMELVLVVDRRRRKRLEHELAEEVL